MICRSCRYQASVTAGTIFEGTRKPLVMWFRAIWCVTAQKNGASALRLQRVLGLGQYQTAWTPLHKLRRAMVRHGTGAYSVDEGGTVAVAVRLDGAPGREVTAPVTAEGGDGATAQGETGEDWSGVPGNVTFGATDTEKSFTLRATDDTADDDARERQALLRYAAGGGNDGKPVRGDGDDQRRQHQRGAGVRLFADVQRGGERRGGGRCESGGQRHGGRHHRLRKLPGGVDGARFRDRRDERRAEFQDGAQLRGALRRRHRQQLPGNGAGDQRQRVRAQQAGGPVLSSPSRSSSITWTATATGYAGIRWPAMAGGRAVAVVDRTNNVIEHFFATVKQGLRRRLGRAHLGRDMEDQPAQAALAREPCGIQTMCKILCGTLDHLPRAFAELDRQELTGATRLQRNNRDAELRRRNRAWANDARQCPPPNPTRTTGR